MFTHVILSSRGTLQRTDRVYQRLPWHGVEKSPHYDVNLPTRALCGWLAKYHQYRKYGKTNRLISLGFPVHWVVERCRNMQNAWGGGKPLHWFRLYQMFFDTVQTVVLVETDTSKFNERCMVTLGRKTPAHCKQLLLGCGHRVTGEEGKRRVVLAGPVGAPPPPAYGLAPPPPPRTHTMNCHADVNYKLWSRSNHWTNWATKSEKNTVSVFCRGRDGHRISRPVLCYRTMQCAPILHGCRLCSCELLWRMAGPSPPRAGHRSRHGDTKFSFPAHYHFTAHLVMWPTLGGRSSDPGQQPDLIIDLLPQPKSIFRTARNSFTKFGGKSSHVEQHLLYWCVQ